MTPSRLLLLFLLCGSFSARAAVNDPGFTQSTFASGLEQVTGIRWAPDGTNRLFALQKTGRVRIVRDGVLLAQPFATETVYTTSECGLIGIAFDPAFVVNRYVYLFVTVSDHEQQIIRYTDVNSVGQERRVLVAGLPTAGANHDGGGIGFGPDGMLYWSIGDLGNRQVGVNDDLTSLASKVSRADRFGLPVNDNPFFDGPGPNADFIWARGFRNPFRLTFQPGSGRLWVSVAGSRYEQIFAVGRGDHGGWVTYENNQPQGFLPPAIAYRTNAAETTTLEGAARAGGVTTFTTVAAHPFRPGAKVFIRGVLDTAFNGDFHVAQVLDDRRFTVVQPGADATSTAGTAATQALGGSVTGGTFYDATAFPSAYQGNFFFGDFNSGNLMRATFAPTGQVASVDIWGTGFAQATDAAVGPDGALYVATFSGTVHRVAYAPQGQAFIVSRTHVDVREGAQASFAVSLAQRPPGGGLTASLALSGDPDLTVASGASLTFTTLNHSVPKIVTVSAARDADSTDDTATLTVSTAGVTSQAVEVVGRDEQPAFELSANILTVAEGGTVTFTVALGTAPAGPVTVSVGPRAGDADTVVSGGATLSFTPADYRTPRTVTLASAEDADEDSELSTFEVTAPGYQARTVSVRVTDNETRPVAFTSTPVTTAVVRAPYRYTAQ
ncbi:MAG TPA: PQQ-dependent sugar dehydrogenase, partial [Longimicrobium sp.]|nr:PQQ-dependent sugar dehydrogenase [Longimicrobium sp.]